MDLNPRLSRVEFDRVFAKYLEDKTCGASILWRLAVNVSTPVDILWRLSEDVDRNSSAVVQEVFLSHKGVPDDMRTLWVLRWDTDVRGAYFHEN